MAAVSPSSDISRGASVCMRKASSMFWISASIAPAAPVPELAPSRAACSAFIAWSRSICFRWPIALPTSRLSHWRCRDFSSGRPIAAEPYCAGRKTDGVLLGTPGMISTNAGRFSFSVPSPYATHDPALGRTSRPEPVKIMFLAVKWSSLSWCSDLMKHRSSISLLVSGNRSDAHAPLRPYCLKLNGERRIWPVGAKENFGLTILAGNGLPSSRWSSGL